MSLPGAVNPERPGDDAAPDDDKLPFTFVLTIVMVAIYVGYRIVQMLWRLGVWLFG